MLVVPRDFILRSKSSKLDVSNSTLAPTESISTRFALQALHTARAFSKFTPPC